MAIKVALQKVNISNALLLFLFDKVIGHNHTLGKKLLKEKQL
ncbi:hypothetical protein [Cardinium endosymbiont of Encarsia pergandiella]|nr:hypothetical protein [Cardinium endosymbiont of Encarsia pergandiella]